MNVKPYWYECMNENKIMIVRLKKKNNDCPVRQFNVQVVRGESIYCSKISERIGRFLNGKTKYRNGENKKKKKKNSELKESHEMERRYSRVESEKQWGGGC